MEQSTATLATKPQFQPLAFTDLTPRAQKTKVSDKRRIEQYWNCDVQNCIPQAIRPKISYSQTSKARIGDATQDCVWWQWSEVFIVKLARLASLTDNKWTSAQQLMIDEVKRRQADATDSRPIIELLVKDLDNIIAELAPMKEPSASEVSKKRAREDDTDQQYIRKDSVTTTLHDNEKCARCTKAGRKCVAGSSVERCGRCKSSNLLCSKVDADREKLKQWGRLPVAENREDTVKSTTTQTTADLWDADTEASKTSQLRKSEETLEVRTQIAKLRLYGLQRRQEATRLEADAAGHRGEAVSCEVEADKLEAKMLKIALG